MGDLLPGAAIATIGTVTVNPSQAGVFSFTPSTTIQLTSGTSYWVVLTASGSTSPVYWANDNANTAPSGSYTYIGYTFNNTSSMTFNSFTLNVSAVPSDEASGANLPAFFDGRINNYDTGNPIIVYGQAFEEGERGLTIYDTEGVLLLVVTPAEIAAVPECPDTNTLIAASASTGVAVYRLAGSCLYQVNAPTGEAGKVYILIFNGLFANAGYTSYEEYIR
ncbi:MAG: choice-of-anchor R domain-containing protein [Anaerolineae bacterium]|nr:choice-of-anchor R domain-containing protein [Anaerolineae bacterium]